MKSTLGRKLRGGTILSQTLALAVLLTAGAVTPALAEDTAQSVEELRDTVINLVNSLVQKGVLTQEQARTLISDAQAKAAAKAKADAAQASTEKQAVHVGYVPEIVQEKIEKQVADTVTPQVKQQVLDEAKSEGWGIPGALPDWVHAYRFYGDVRFRAEDDQYAPGNAVNAYLNFNNVNAAGGITKAGTGAFLDTTVDRFATYGRLRLGLVVDLGNAVSLDMRIGSGNQVNPVSLNQVLGNYDGRWAIGVDHAAILWNPTNAAGDQELDLRAGRFANPFVTNTELVWDVDVAFEGVSATYAIDLFDHDDVKMHRGAFITLGAFPIQQIAQNSALSVNNKWLYAGQLGTQFPLPFGDETSLRLTAAYYDFQNITGVQNPPNSSIENFTAPSFVQKGNTMFDIANYPNDPTINIFALAAKYRLLNVNALLDVIAFGENHASLSLEYVKNLGWSSQQVYELTGAQVAGRTNGYDATVSLGRPVVEKARDWRAWIGYRSVERDAVVDAFDDSDFHLGGTDARGYLIGFDYGLSHGLWTRLRYMAAHEIDGPPLTIDVWQLDLNGRF